MVLRTLSGSTYVLVTDTHVAKLHSVAFDEAFPGSPFLSHVIPPGGMPKSRQGKADSEDFLLANACTRSAIILAPGGGVIGNLGGFAAAKFMQGVRFVSILTTLLAMANTNVGGKIAIDTPHGMNLIGAFWQPGYVIIDAAFLESLPSREFVMGWPKLSSDLERDRVRAHVGRHSFRHPNGVNLVSRLRNLVNFGHTIGHAIEAVLAPAALNGNRVSVGVILEAEATRQLGILTQGAVGRLTRCFASYNLPVSLADPRLASLPAARGLSVDRLPDIMRIDTKTSGSEKKIVLLPCIGTTHEPRATGVAGNVIRKTLSFATRFIPGIPSKFPVTMATPRWKSISKMALMLATLVKDTCRLTGLPHSDDTQVMMNALIELQVFDPYVPWCRVQNSFGKTKARLRLSKEAKGSSELLGTISIFTWETSSIGFLESQRCLLLAIGAGGFRGGKVRLAASVSSQYASLILFCASYAAEPVVLELTGGAVIFQPYIKMTIATMRKFGVAVTSDADPKTGKLLDVYRILSAVCVNPGDYSIESDASNATYALGIAAITGTTCTIFNIGACLTSSIRVAHHPPSLVAFMSFFRGSIAKSGAGMKELDDGSKVYGHGTMVESTKRKDERWDVAR
ncbi:hypothetical protein BOTBODRAFT_49154 [Botryobasidium botryosum FD-172 SS1]|uniref:3-dehydroquinate synthase domain-containing protein n=1 Tax=Botryobasidium botryosum (strain FD-172 SS1) TaxID=930990 RepID=A0A067M4R2_BOTB1|nr:hypothetical protein BOTBODRAFT_49154 [Botryobasidium botryosum FD-172 SS1]